MNRILGNLEESIITMRPDSGIAYKNQQGANIIKLIEREGSHSRHEMNADLMEQKGIE